MNLAHPFRTRSLARLALASVVLGPAARAQVDYSFNWHNLSNGFLGGLSYASGAELFGALSGDAHKERPGDTIRTCYGIDQLQGGAGEDGAVDLSWFMIVISYGYGVSGTQLPAQLSVHPDPGMLSVSTASVDSLEGDACFSPLFAQGVDSVTGQPIRLEHRVHFVMDPPPVVGTSAFPNFWFLYYRFLDGQSLDATNVLGLEPGGLGEFRDPLLTNLIFETQGPLNTYDLSGGFYYLAATSEHLGLGQGGEGTGGVTNGNGRQGLAMTGLTADLSGAVAHNRLTALGNDGTLTGAMTLDVAGPGSTHWLSAGIATETPVLWAASDGRAGGGGSDPSIGSSVSTLQWRVIDHRAGCEGNPLDPLYDPGLSANLAVVLFSATPAVGMLQTPMSWDTLGGTQPGAPGSTVLGAQVTMRRGLQTVPANFDPLMLNLLLNQPQFTLGISFAASYSTAGSSEWRDALLERPEGIGGPGQSTMAAPLPISAAPNPNLVGRKVGMAAFGLQIRPGSSQAGITEFATAMTLNLQD